MASSEASLFEFEIVIRGHHIYKGLWTPVLGENLDVQREPSNPYDSRAVSVERSGEVVGHVPREVRRTFFSFLTHGGNISCEVIGSRRYGKGLEVPCLYKFEGPEEAVLKAKKTLGMLKNCKNYS